MRIFHACNRRDGNTYPAVYLRELEKPVNFDVTEDRIALQYLARKFVNCEMPKDAVSISYANGVFPDWHPDKLADARLMSALKSKDAAKGDGCPVDPRCGRLSHRRI